MKLHLKILLFNLIIVGVLGWLFSTGGSNPTLNFGILFSMSGLIAIFISLLTLVVPNKSYAKGFLLTAGLFFLIGFVSCANS